MQNFSIKIKSIEFAFVLSCLMTLTFNVIFFNFINFRIMFGVLALASFSVLLIESKSFLNEINRDKIILFFLLALLFGLISRDLINETSSEIHIFISLFFAFILSKFPLNLSKILIFGLFTSTIIMFVEFFVLKEYLFNIHTPPYKFEKNRLQGLFSYSKEAAGYSAAVSFYLYSFYKMKKIKYNYTYWLVLFLSLLSGFLTGARIGYFIPLIIILISISNTNSVKIYLGFFVIIITIVISSLYLDLIHWEYILGRTSQALDFTSSGNLQRIGYWTDHLDLFFRQSFWKQMFGVGNEISMIVENGAENLYITILTQHGFFGFLFFLIIVLIVILSIRPSYKDLIILLTIFSAMFFSNIFSGWSDGIIMWSGILLLRQNQNLLVKTNLI